MLLTILFFSRVAIWPFQGWPLALYCKFCYFFQCIKITTCSTFFLKNFRVKRTTSIFALLKLCSVFYYKNSLKIRPVWSFFLEFSLLILNYDKNLALWYFWAWQPWLKNSTLRMRVCSSVHKVHGKLYTNEKAVVPNEEFYIIRLERV